MHNKRQAPKPLRICAKPFLVEVGTTKSSLPHLHSANSPTCTVPALRSILPMNELKYFTVSESNEIPVSSRDCLDPIGRFTIEKISCTVL